MSLQPAVRARPVADAPVDALLAQADELARRWALALMVGRPLEEIADLPLGEFARAAPALCAALVRALASDDALERLARGDERAALAPSLSIGRGGALVADVDALRSILWEATLQQLRDPPVRLVADLADRLAHVCASATAALLDEPAADAGAPAPAHAPAAPRAQAQARVRAAASEPPAYASERRVAGRHGAVLIDELGQEPRPLAAPEELEGELPRTPREGTAPIANGPREERESSAPWAPPSASPADPASPGGPPSPPPRQPPRATPRARPWDTPLGDEPPLRVRRGRDARIDGGG
jgi:hypothetical protein